MKHKLKDQNDVDVCCDVRVYVNVGCDADMLVLTLMLMKAKLV